LAVVNLWTRRLCEWSEVQSAALAGWLIVACGVLLDLCGETKLILWAGKPQINEVGFALALVWYQRLSPAAANGLYCIGGLLLSAVSWQVGLVRGLTGALGIAMWLVGMGLTLATQAGSTAGMAVTGAGVMLLYLVWAPLLALRVSGREAASPAGKSKVQG
jgi:hypothetical protein